MPENLALGNDHQLVGPQTLLHGGDGDCAVEPRISERGQVGGLSRTYAGRVQEFQEHLAAPGRVGHEKHRLGDAVEKLAQAARGVPQPGIGFQISAGLSCEVDRVTGAGVVDDDLRPGLQRGVELLSAQVDVGRGKNGSLHVVTQALVANAHVVKKPLGGFPNAGLPDDHGVGWQVVEERSQLFEEEGQVVLDAVRGDALADVLVDAASPHVDVERVVPVAPESCDGVAIQGKFLCGQQPNRVYLLDGALGVGVERPQAFHLVVEQVDTDGQIRSHGVDVHQRTAHGVLPVSAYRLCRVVPRRVEPAALRIQVEVLARAK